MGAQINVCPPPKVFLNGATDPAIGWTRVSAQQSRHFYSETLELRLKVSRKCVSKKIPTLRCFDNIFFRTIVSYSKFFFSVVGYMSRIGATEKGNLLRKQLLLHIMQKDGS